MYTGDMYDYEEPIDFSVVERASEPLEDEQPRWTPRRVFYLILALIIILAFLLYMLYPLLSSLQNHPQYIPITNDYQQTWLLRL